MNKRMSSSGEIIAVGGHWSYWLHYALAQVKDPRPGLLATAAGDRETEIDRFYQIAHDLSSRPQHFSLFDDPAEKDPGGWVGQQNVIVISGGREEVAKAAWDEDGVSHALRDFWERGGILLASEEGAGLLFSLALDRHGGSYRGYGFLEDSFCFNYTNYKNKYRQLIKGGDITPGYGINRQTGIHFVGKNLWRAISLVDTTEVYYLDREGRERDHQTTVIAEAP